MSNINPVTEASVEATPLPPQPAVTNPVPLRRFCRWKTSR